MNMSNGHTQGIGEIKKKEDEENGQDNACERAL
jgi:hypothetical protein